MALKLQLKKGQKVIINGAVLENLGSHTISLGVMNRASILRENDILTPEDATTPASRVYYAVQCIYLFPDEHGKYHALFEELAAAYAAAAPSSGELVNELRQFVEDGNLYEALKKAKDLIGHEGRVLSHAEKRLGEELSEGSGEARPEDG
ncbi:MAG: flagellar biosynthesis repressor FlbT [Rhodospirillales bacterium]|nr:flagellar biosynthesis repressor FlbT [Rhodospirillales bacterium]MCW8952911.1 flagellar biosynthesis repressor FlbT [Rhodospirillales bacterium]MCW8970261.1 flagellar biosynthesis repressor FlbT [Rhodospirillales bacterium]MCW9002561.1 flagellar biosynthesis repressor FlbT [Rhodospirillales bacterium]MCW9039920.1 flagellar biosynthesis repressor FlbT [Rhodospirillales bacterium]